MTLEQFLTQIAEGVAPADNGFFFDHRSYREDVNDDARTNAWLEINTSYIWKVGVLAQWDSNKCDHVHLFVGHEREPGNQEFIGWLYWRGGENDDIGRCINRYLKLIEPIHPVFQAN